MVPRGCGGVQDTGYLTSISANSEYSSGALSELREWLLRASVTISNGEVPQEPHRGLSPLVFDLLPNPSFDHLVPVILMYPREEESG